MAQGNAKASKTLVIYYSFEGSTKAMAEAIAKTLKADLMPLVPKGQPKVEGFKKYWWGGKQVMFKTKPELEDFSKDPQFYDALIVGTPVWAWTFSPPLRSFFTFNKFKGKKYGLFCCHEGGPGKTLANMKAELEGNEFLGSIDFMNVVKDKKACLAKAKAWAKEVSAKL